LSARLVQAVHALSRRAVEPSPIALPARRADAARCAALPRPARDVAPRAAVDAPLASRL